MFRFHITQVLGSKGYKMMNCVFYHNKREKGPEL
jgi:hypothetical protein